MYKIRHRQPTFSQTSHNSTFMPVSHDWNKVCRSPIFLNLCNFATKIFHHPSVNMDESNFFSSLSHHPAVVAYTWICTKSIRISPKLIQIASFSQNILRANHSCHFRAKTFNLSTKNDVMFVQTIYFNVLSGVGEPH